ncbi:hypothetical protein ACI65C_013541 [Semiaphis heraclei]
MQQQQQQHHEIFEFNLKLVEKPTFGGTTEDYDRVIDRHLHHVNVYRCKLLSARLMSTPIFRFKSVKFPYQKTTNERRIRFFSDSTNFGNTPDSELEKNIILDNNVKILDKSICFDLNICQEVPQCPQTVTSSSHVDNYLDNECVDSIDTNDCPALLNESDSSTSGSDNNYKFSSISSEISQWALTHKIPHNSINDLLFILKKHKCFTMLPKDARTLLGTKPVPILNMHEHWDISEAKAKVMIMPCNDELVAFPLLHSI